MYNNNVLPVVYELGSLGASGDLAPLAHLSLALLGEGDVDYVGKRMPASEALEKLNWQPLELRSKEGLALLNGTQFMSAYGLWSLMQANHLTEMANKIAALSLDAFDCSSDPFDELIHQVRPHSGQLEVAASINKLREGSAIMAAEKEHVQDPYSFRCIPQVHGASIDAIRHIQHVFETELNSVTDNPNIFPEQDKILSGGNFHGQPLAINLDYLCIALAEMGSISERRTYQLINGKRALPPFLVKEPGLNSGLMIPQYTAASIVSQNKQLCTPASVDTIDSSAGQEDHVSMGANAATKTYRIVKNVERILAIELLSATQALEFRRPSQSSSLIEDMVRAYRKDVPFIDADRKLHDDIEASVRFLHK
jgi:histidine ammonia-lyase